MLKLINLSVNINGRRILDNINLHIKEGQTFVLFGPNGSGKSSLLMTIIGNPKYKISTGKIIFKGEDITNLPTNERIKMGIGVAFQNPPKINGIKLIDILKYCAKLGKTEDMIDEYVKLLKMEDLLYRDINVGFSGGEMKKAEILQLMLLNPDLVMLDEPDSGVDLENIALIGKAIRTLLERDKAKNERVKSGIIITHTGHILKYIDADYGMVLYGGRIVRIGDPFDILEDISELGYERCIKRWLKNRG
ncbi:MAG TPA: ABC transporter ATP-binding protein [Archaeoglobus profundus]|nr:ABC transporter ATP-binding protein [Archaeoglobus profundus]